jgi:hypothetical protein
MVNLLENGCCDEIPAWGGFIAVRLLKKMDEIPKIGKLAH